MRRKNRLGDHCLRNEREGKTGWETTVLEMNEKEKPAGETTVLEMNEKEKPGWGDHCLSFRELVFEVRCSLRVSDIGLAKQFTWVFP